MTCITLRLAFAAMIIFAQSVAAQNINRLVTLDAAGQPPAAAPGHSDEPALAQNGRLVVFSSTAAYLVAGDTNGVRDIFLRDMLTQTTMRLTVGLGGAQINDDAQAPVISEDGRHVAFMSWATNLVAGINDGRRHVYLLDRNNGQITMQDRDSSGNPASYNATPPMAMSPNGRYLAFSSFSSDLVASDTNGRQDIFVRDLQAGTTMRVSLSTSGAEISSDASNPSISNDGRFVAFESTASELGGNGDIDVFLHDAQTHATTLVSVNPGAGPAVDSGFPHISAGGSLVAFETTYRYDPSNGGALNSHDIYVYDRVAHTYRWSSPTLSGATASMDVRDDFALSGDGRYVAYEGTFVEPAGRVTFNVFRYDRLTAQTIRVTLPLGGPLLGSTGDSPAISFHGNAVAFRSSASDLVAGAGNGEFAIYQWAPSNIADLDHIFTDGFDPAQ